MNVHIRLYTPADLHSCHSLWEELTQRHRDIYADPTIGGDEPGLFFDRHLAQVGTERIWVAELDNQVVGLVRLMVDEREADEDVGVVEPIVVARSHQGLGIGRALLAHMVSEAKKLGMHFLSVKPVARNKEAIFLYHACGFQILGEIEMVMELQPSAPDTWKTGLEIFGHVFKY
ncbi:MAG: GNAT family N-acetyltransferase [Anaerolineales bacterium]|nr:GNAT family N-acetyltransferase [Anaerolineales bacterium]